MAIVENANLRAQLRRDDRIRRQRRVGEMLAVYDKWTAGQMGLEQFARTVGETVDAYAAEGLAEIAALSPELARAVGESWLGKHVRDGLRSVAVALRDAIGDPAIRHTVAQVLQARLLHAELEARRLIASRVNAVSVRAESDGQR